MPLENQRLSYNGTNIDFPRTSEYNELGDYDHIIHTDKNGGTIIYRRYEKEEWTVDVICTKTEADTNIRAWMENRYQISFYPEHTTTPATVYSVKILNPTFPFMPWSMGKWRGTLKLRNLV